MNNEFSNAEFWNSLYEFAGQGWDIGYPSPALCAYFNQIETKNLRILIPGAGNAYEAEYLHRQNFKSVFVLDFAERALKNFKNRVPNFPEHHILKEDFFLHQGSYDIIAEQTFFSSMPPELREKFVQKIAELLSPGGIYFGLFFNHEFENDKPPFGAEYIDYQKLFEPYFDIQTLELSYNTIKARAGRELFFIFRKK